MTRSIKAGLARPVRIVVSSRCIASTLLSILDSASARIGSITGGHQGSDLVPPHDSLDVALLEEVEDDDRQLVVHAERQRGVVHDVDALLIQSLKVVEPLVLFRV